MTTQQRESIVIDQRHATGTRWPDMPDRPPAATWDFGFGSIVVAIGSPAEQITWVDPITQVQSRVERLEARVSALEEEVQMLRASVGEEVIVLRAISKEQAKQEIRSLYSSGEVLYFSDITKRLGIDLPLVVEICMELKEEGGIELAEDAL